MSETLWIAPWSRALTRRHVGANEEKNKHRDRLQNFENVPIDSNESTIVVPKAKHWSTRQRLPRVFVVGRVLWMVPDLLGRNLC